MDGTCRAAQKEQLKMSASFKYGILDACRRLHGLTDVRLPLEKKFELLAEFSKLKISEEFVEVIHDRIFSVMYNDGNPLITELDSTPQYLNWYLDTWYNVISADISYDDWVDLGFDVFVPFAFEDIGLKPTEYGRCTGLETGMARLSEMDRYDAVVSQMYLATLTGFIVHIH